VPYYELLNGDPPPSLYFPAQWKIFSKFPTDPFFPDGKNGLMVEEFSLPSFLLLAGYLFSPGRPGASQVRESFLQLSVSQNASLCGTAFFHPEIPSFATSFTTWHFSSLVHKESLPARLPSSITRAFLTLPSQLPGPSPCQLKTILPLPTCRHAATLFIRTAGETVFSSSGTLSIFYFWHPFFEG